MSTTATAATTSGSRLLRAERPAVSIAISLHRQPALLRSVPRREIPKDIIEVLRIAAGQQDSIQAACLAFDTTESELVASAELYLQIILTNARANDRRMLCLHESATPADVKDHRRLLLKWLHPDRNRDNWESALFLKVKEASSRLEGQLGVEPKRVSTAVLASSKESKRRHARRRAGMPRVQQDNGGLFRSAAKPVLLVAMLVACSIMVLVNLLPNNPAVKILTSAFSF